MFHIKAKHAPSFLFLTTENKHLTFYCFCKLTKCFYWGKKRFNRPKWLAFLFLSWGHLVNKDSVWLEIHFIGPHRLNCTKQLSISRHVPSLMSCHTVYLCKLYLLVDTYGLLSLWIWNLLPQNKVNEMTPFTLIDFW